LENNDRLIDSPVLARSNKRNSRLGNRKQHRQNRDRVRNEQQLDNEEEMDDENNEEDRNIRKRRLL